MNAVAVSQPNSVWRSVITELPRIAILSVKVPFFVVVNVCVCQAIFGEWMDATLFFFAMTCGVNALKRSMEIQRTVVEVTDAKQKANTRAVAQCLALGALFVIITSPVIFCIQFQRTLMARAE